MDRLNRLCVALIFFAATVAYADTFEYLTFTPPQGWSRQPLQEGIAYRRETGVGLITFYTSTPSNGSASEEFRRMWSARVTPVLAGAPPEHQIQQDGAYTVVVGAQQVDAEGTRTTIGLATIVGQGRTLGVLTISAGDDLLREITAFLDTIQITPGDTPTAQQSPANSSDTIQVDFDVPPGYVAQKDGARIVFTPKSVNDKTPCGYGISPSRPSSGSLETDARNALLEPLPGWQIKNQEHYNAVRGTSGAGWPYYWFRTDVQRLVGGNYEYATAMSMAFAATGGKVHIVWGAGNPARCTLDDLAFAQLFHSLRPRGWNADGGKSLLQELQGTWRNSQSPGMAQYKFLPNGKYEYGIATTTTTGSLQRTSSGVSDGRYQLRGSELTITPDRTDRGPTKFQVRIYDEFVLGKWTRAMSLLDAKANPPLDVQYMRVDE